MAEIKERKMKELKNGRSKLLDCNYDVLNNLILSRGFNPRDLAEMLGYERGYFTKVRSRGKIGLNCVNLLKVRYNILPQQYEVAGYQEIETQSQIDSSQVKKKILDKVNKPESKAESIVLKITVDTDQLKQIVKQAVIEAFNSL